MKFQRTLTALLILAALVCLSALPAFAQETRELRVKVSYTGTGTVDSTHGIHLYLFDTPDISAGSMPIGMSSAWENGSVVVFSGISSQTVYLAGAYGDYDPSMGPPPSGTPVSLYRPGEPTPTPIAMDQAVVEIEFAFDDSFRMP
ncbi:MAG: hypothetical protein Kow001_18450 [Acidobacteriota bacterium]